MEMLEIETRRFFWAVHIVSDPIYHGASTFVFYKNPADIPEEFYARIGKKKNSAPNEAGLRTS